MNTIFRDKQIRYEWRIRKSPGMDLEHFERANLGVFLIGAGEIRALTLSSIAGGVLEGIIPSGLPAGVYDLKAMWTKNEAAQRPLPRPLPPHRHDDCPNWELDNRCLMVAYVDGAFALTDVQSEETEPLNPVLKIESFVATYGYDGMSAYESAVLRGLWSGTESEYLGLISGKEFEQKQSDWTQTDINEKDYIKNKPDVYTKAEVNSRLEGMDIDSGYVVKIRQDGSSRRVAIMEDDTGTEITGIIPSTDAYSSWEQGKDTVLPTLGLVKAKINAIDVSSQVSGKADKSEMSVATNGDKTTITLKQGTSAEVINQHQDISGKQDVISDLATIRSGAAAGATAVQPAAMNTALAGKQDTLTFDSTPTASSTNPVTSGGVKSSLDAKADKSDTYTKAEIGNLITPIDSEVIVGALPASGVANKVYRVPGTDSYTDYGWDGTQFVTLGTFAYGVDTSLAWGSSHLITNDGVVKSDAWKLSSRAAVTFSGDTITIGNGYLYFYKGNIYRGKNHASATYDLTGSKFLVWDVAGNALSVKSNSAVGDVIMMYHDAVDKWSFGLLMPYWLRSIDKGLDTRLGVVETSMGQFTDKTLTDNWGCVCRPKVTFEGNVVTFGVGWMYFYKGNQFYTAYNVTEQTSYTVPNNNFLVFNRTSRTISVVSSLSDGDLVLLEYDPTLTEHWSYGLLNRKYLQYLIENIEIPEPSTDEIPAFVKTASFDAFKRMSGVVTYDSFMLAHITDVHSNAANELTKYKQVGYLNALNKEYGFDALVNNGDIGLDVGETEEQASALMYNTKECMNCTSPWLYVKGNHERTHTDTKLASIFVRPTKSQFPQLTYGDSTGIYGHIDYADKKVRVIYLNTTDAAVGTHYGISNTQFQWLIATLGSVQDGWRVVVLSHLTPHEIGRWATESGTQPDQMAFSVNLRAVLSAYVNRRSGSFDSVSYDFSSAQGKLVCILCGDSHFNNYVKDDGVNYIVRQGYGGVSDANLPSGATKDTFSWDAQCLFDVLTINSATSATVFRIGAGGSERDLTITY